MTNSLWDSKIFVKVWKTTLSLFAISVLVSKSGLQIFGLLLLFLSIAGLNWKKFFEEEKLGTIVVLLYPFAILCGFLSLGGVASAGHVALAWPWPLLALPTVLIKWRGEDIRILAYSLSMGLAIACLKCFYNFETMFNGVFENLTRVPSFWDISRWGLFTGMAMIFLMTVFVGKSAKEILTSRKEVAFFVLLAADFICLVLSNNRGPWLSFVISAFVMLLLFPKSWKIVCSVVLVFIVTVLITNYSRVSSIAEVQTGHGEVSSKDPSNMGRLHMWKVAIDFFEEQPFFGTGFENTEDSLRSFLGRQTEVYRQKYTTIEFSYRDQHSSFLSMLVQMGAVFSLAFWLTVVVGLLLWFKEWRQKRSLFSSTVIACICFHLILGIFYTSFLSYEIVTFIPLLVMRRSPNANS